MLIDNGRLDIGDVVQHFKRELLPPERTGSSDYLYVIQAIATHSETGEQMVVYKALYGDHQVYVRPLDMFISKVDVEKYPAVQQEYRFERVSTKYDKPLGE